MLKKAKRSNPEADIQRSIVRLLWQIIAPGSVLHHSANEVRAGGEKGKRDQGLAMGMGVFAGFSDLVLLAPDGRVLFLEVKTAKGPQSDAQAEFQRLVEAMGHAYEIVRSADDAIAALREHSFPTRIRAFG